MNNNRIKDWGIRIRKGPGYYAIWNNLKTVRLDQGEEQPLPPERSEFYDVSLTTRCNSSCPFCYVSASSDGMDAPRPGDTWKSWMSTFPEDKDASEDPVILELCEAPKKGESLEVLKLRLLVSLAKAQGIPIMETQKPFQLAVGSTGEPTVHPELCEFLETVYSTSVVPNYTTNGIILSDKTRSERILEYTKAYCGGVAVSFGNPGLRPLAMRAIENLLSLDSCKVVVHHILGNTIEVDEFVDLQKSFGQDIHYHVLLPLMKHGRSTKTMEPGTYEYLAKKLREEGIKNVAFGANFAPYMMKSPGLIDVWEYPQDTYSKNLILGDREITITPSSFDLKPCKVITGL